jgi:outer membrane protein OmpA-like peptidoglycan-associated protein
VTNLRAVAGIMAIAVVAGRFVAGCTGFQGPAVVQPCDWMSGEATGGRTAILLDISNSTRSNGISGSAPDYAAALTESISHAVDRRDTVSIAAFSGRVGDLVWAARDLSTDYRAGNDNPDNQKDRRTEALRCLEESVAAAQHATPLSAGTDVLGALRQALGWVTAGPEPGNLVVATDGLVTTGCADLTRSSFTSQREIRAIVDLCKQREEFDNATLGGVTVTLLGIGRPSSDQPVPTPQQAEWLKRLWQELCGGTCSISAAAVAGADRSGSSGKTREVGDPAVGFQRGKQVYALPSPLLFDTNSARLKPAAGPVLEDIAVLIRSTDFARIDVNGYADPRGDPDENRVLSLRRAESVARALGPALAGRPHGMGVTRNCPYAMVLPDGANEDDLPCARRVEIVVTTKDER